VLQTVSCKILTLAGGPQTEKRGVSNFLALSPWAYRHSTWLYFQTETWPCTCSFDFTSQASFVYFYYYPYYSPPKGHT